MTATDYSPLSVRPPRPADLELEVPTHEHEYRDEHGNILAEWDDDDAANTVRNTLMADGHRVLRAYVRGVKTLGSYGDVR